MKFSGSIGIILALAFMQSAVAQEPDTVWICREDTGEVNYLHMFLADTFPQDIYPFSMVDTGDPLEGKYINFDYQFTTDSVYRYDSTRTNCPNDVPGDTLVYRGLRPGYAGFKIFWDCGSGTFWVGDYDSMILWHKGPLPGHKVRMIWAQGSAGCGTPINYEYLGEFASSTSWTRESFPFPAGFVKNGLFELRMLINNDSLNGDTSSNSAMGNLKIDNMYFLLGPAQPPAIFTQPKSQTVDVDSPVTFNVVLSMGRSPQYQWQKNGNPIPDATSSSYSIVSAQPSDAGSYTVIVSNDQGTVTSNAAILTVTAKEEKKSCGCGSGTGIALIPPLFYKAMANRKRKKKNPKT